MCAAVDGLERRVSARKQAFAQAGHHAVLRLSGSSAAEPIHSAPIPTTFYSVQTAHYACSLPTGGRGLGGSGPKGWAWRAGEIAIGGTSATGFLRQFKQAHPRGDNKGQGGESLGVFWGLGEGEGFWGNTAGHTRRGAKRFVLSPHFLVRRLGLVCALHHAPGPLGSCNPYMDDEFDEWMDGRTDGWTDRRVEGGIGVGVKISGIAARRANFDAHAIPCHPMPVPLPQR